MVNTNCTTNKKIESTLEHALNDIATDAGLVLDLLSDLADQLGSKKPLYAKCCAIENLVAKIGAVADREVMAGGGVPAFGDADRWFHLPGYLEAGAPGGNMRVAAAPTGRPGSSSLSLDDEDTLAARITHAHAIVKAMWIAVTAASDGGGELALSEATLSDNLAAAGEFLYQAEAVLDSPRAN